MVSAVMSIRWKLFIVLAVLSLGPTLFLRLNGQRAMTQVGQAMTQSAREALVDEASGSLLRLVEDHARVLARERQLLEAALERVLDRLAEAPPGQAAGQSATPDGPGRSGWLGRPGRSDAPDDPESHAPQGEPEVHPASVPGEPTRRQSLLVDFNALSVWDEVSPARVRDDHAALETFKETHGRYGELLLWQMAATPEEWLLYPALPPGRLAAPASLGQRGQARCLRGDALTDAPWTARACSAAERFAMLLDQGDGWLGPLPDAVTGRPVFLLAGAGANGVRAALATPLRALFHTQMHLPAISPRMETMLAAPSQGRLEVLATTMLTSPDAVNGTDGLAGAGARRSGANHPHDLHDLQDQAGPARGAWRLGGPGGNEREQQPAHGGFTVDLPAVSQAMATQDSGLVEAPWRGQPSLWAFASIALRAHRPDHGAAGGMSDDAADPGPTDGPHLILIAPTADVTASADALAASLEARIQQHLWTTGLLVAAALVVALAVSYVVSLTFTRRLSRLAHQAQRLAAGDFSARANLPGHDEVGALGQVLDSVGPALEERLRLHEALDLAQEVQHSLLPPQPPTVPGLEFAARIEYCEKTGGDFYDFVSRPGAPDDVTTTVAPHGALLAVVGDVSGHGVHAALLMASTRAFLRSRAAAPAWRASLEAVLEHVNRQLVRDVEGAGHFVTLFAVEADLPPPGRTPEAGVTVRWARAGHDPALLFHPAEDFTELRGEGLSLGVVETTPARAQTLTLRPGSVLLMGTDGIAERRNRQGAMYGRTRFRTVAARHAHEDADAIVAAVFDDLAAFSEGVPAEDDVTLMVIKAV